jgi:hypothetical protein
MRATMAADDNPVRKARPRRATAGDQRPGIRAGREGAKRSPRRRPSGTGDGLASAGPVDASPFCPLRANPGPRTW